MENKLKINSIILLSILITVIGFIYFAIYPLSNYVMDKFSQKPDNSENIEIKFDQSTLKKINNLQDRYQSFQ
ncbi:hypothetical protein COZ97_04450 [bacterium CG_4_8_14_3_um_filter_33_28]|nr:MAG: hypothetical protein COZ97_04450 [bacterium CG_4_8_14_3_um_filter_33_28]PIY85140.1 MAG: hypothetical protein COY76_03745 [bacterium CG_4_10_14_0_8_um_filter_33_57]